MSEQRNAVHQEMFKSLLRTPHRFGDETLALHREQYKLDPNFYGKLAIWAVLHGNNVVRDVNEIFIAMLFASEYPEHREAAYVMLQSLPPYQVTRVVRYVTGYDEVIKHVSISKKEGPKPGFGVTVTPLTYGKRHPQAGKMVPRKVVKIGPKLSRELVAKGAISPTQKEYFVDSFFVKHECLGKRSVGGMLRKSIKTYLRWREKPENQGMLEGALIRARDDMYGLYIRTHTLPGGDQNSWINKFLFKNEIDESLPQMKRLAALRRLSKIEDPVKQAELIVENKLPYPQVISVVNKITPTVLVALIDAMSPQELLSNLGSLKSRGAMDNADIKALIETKIKKIKTTKSSRIDALKGAAAAKAVGDLPDDIAKVAAEATDSQLKFHGRIKSTTALLIDKSGSMDQAIELGKQLAATLAQACESQAPRVYMFDRVPTEIVWNKNDGDIMSKSSWDRKLKMFSANGGTEPHNVIRAMISQNISVEQIVLVTDEGENSAGRFAAELKNYERKFGFMPNIVIARVGGRNAADVMEKSMKAVGIDVEVLVCDKADSVSIPNLLQLLSRTSIFDLVLEISMLPLPSRDEWDSRHGMKDSQVGSTV